MEEYIINNAIFNLAANNLKNQGYHVRIKTNNQHIEELHVSKVYKGKLFQNTLNMSNSIKVVALERLAMEMSGIEPLN